MENPIGKVIRFPNKRQRAAARKKFFSLYTIHEVFNVTIGVLIAQFITWILTGRF